MRNLPLISAAVVAGLFAASGAAAQQVEFNGTRENVNPLSPPGSGRCSPPNFNTVTIAPGAISSTGTSNIGTFTSMQSHCIVTPPPTDLVDGEFVYNLAAGDSIRGTYTGRTDTSGTPGQFVATENLVITGGTGRFVGATGTIASTGTLGFANGNGVFQGTLTGNIIATATTQTGNFALALGQGVAAQGDYATAVGGLAIANGARTTAVGSGAAASSNGATAIGDRTVASNTASTALGQQAEATGIAASALGHNTRATGIASTAVGVSANAAGVGATAVGRLANAAFAGSTAVGAGATTTAANQVALGATGSSVRVGDIAASTAAQSGPVSVATVDAAGTLGRDTTLFSRITSLEVAGTTQAGAIGVLTDRVSELFDLRDEDRTDMRKAVAAATAMGHAPFPSEPGRTSYVLNGAVFRGEAAVGGSLMHRLKTERPFAIGVGFSFAGEKNNAFRAGVAGEF